MYVKVLVLLCAFFNATCAFVVKTNENDLFRLDVVHYNDFHARFEETSIDYPVCKTNDTSCLGGFSRLYHEIQVLMQEKPGSLLLNAGDNFQGTYWYTLMKWNVTQRFINMLPNDAHAIGNHEFDNGIPGIAPFLAALRAPVVAANIDLTAVPELQALIVPSTVVKRKGRRIGIIGLITQETATSSHSEGVTFLDPIETTRTEAKKLTDEGIDIIIVLSHCGLSIDKKIAKQAGENVDVIVGGHSHSLLWNGDSPSKEEISGPYPVLIENDDGHKILIVTASAFSKYVGNLTTYFDANGELQSYEGTPVFLNRSIAEDPEITALLKPYAEILHTLVNKEIAYSKDDLVAKPCGSQECAIGNLIADSLVSFTKLKRISNLTHISIVLRNSIRGSIAKGKIDRGAVINVLPFANKVVTFRLLGKYMVKTLENSVASFWTKRPFEGPRVPHVSGMRVILNTTDATAKSVAVKINDVFEPINLAEEYQVTTFDFITFGGKGFAVLRENARDVTVLGRDEDVVEEYMMKISPISAVLDNRLTLVD